ncbi:hypothetical protein C8J56DRAFT_249609 [Mycena floridula]|nr:hypothetical protein C8J56DRAFT_249609 [Mycena floridula]
MSSTFRCGIIYIHWTSRGLTLTSISSHSLCHLSGRRNQICSFIYGIGSFQQDAVLKACVNDLFEPGQNIFLVNVSRSGKPRLLHEGLHRHWGFYFTSDVETGALGSSDVSEATRQLGFTQDFC